MIVMMQIVYEFFGIAGLVAPTNMAELIPYLLQFFVALGLTLGVFKVVGHICSFFFSWRWFG